MFRKLLKYDLKYIYKVLIVFYLITLTCAILTRLCFEFNRTSFMSLIGLILQGTAISMIFSLLINNAMRCWARLVKNFYGDESYLTHTLPVKQSTLFAAKFCATLITFFSSLLVIGVTLLIMYYSKENFAALELLFENALSESLSLWSMVALVGLLLFLELLAMIMAGYTGIICGHRRPSHKMLWSIILGLVYYGLAQIFVLAILGLVALANQNAMTLFTSNAMPDLGTLLLLCGAGALAYVICVGVGYCADQKMLSRGVDIE